MILGQMILYKQRGRNNKYPEKIEVWKLNEEIVPNWLSDVAKVSAINTGKNTVQIGFRKLSTGGIEIPDSSGQSILVKLDSEESFICKDTNARIGGIFSLTPKQLELLYVKV